MATVDLRQARHLHDKPLIEISAAYRWVDAKNWRTVLPSFKIANVTFRQLGQSWLRGIEWRAEENK